MRSHLDRRRRRSGVQTARAAEKHCDWQAAPLQREISMKGTKKMGKKQRKVKQK